MTAGEMQGAPVKSDMLAGQRVAVTGATGFIGRYIVRSLLGHGAHVVAVVRNPDKVPSFREMGVELRRADLADREALAAGFAGADAVISNAGVISLAGSSRAALIEQNLVGTRNVFLAIADAGVKRAIQTSSASVYANKRGQYYTEDDALRTADDLNLPFTAYAISKACAETEAWRLADAHGVALSTVRPHSVHGAFDRNSFTKYFKMLVKPPITVFPTHMRFPSVYAGDIGEAMCLMLTTAAAHGRAYNICGEPGEHSYWDLLEAWKAAGGKVPKIVIPVPVPISYRYSIRRAQEDLGWENRPLVDGFREMIALEKAEGIS